MNMTTGLPFSGNVLDARIKELLSKGLGTKVRQADPILPEDEEIIWTSGVFGLHSSQALQFSFITARYSV